MARRTVLVVGASGVIGESAVRHFAGVDDCEVVGVSRRAPRDAGGRFVSVDLTDAARCREIFGAMSAVTHVVYAALFEQPGLVAGWQDDEHRRVNLAMLRNVLDPLLAAAEGLRHVTLLQGTKAYGAHVGPVPVPARERMPRHDHRNFYFDQEDDLRARRDGASWTFTILRPQVVYGESLGSPMNLVPAIGVYAALRREQGLPLTFPGGAPSVSEAVDAALLARAIDWSGTAPEARDQIFNITNGDVLAWRPVWPVIADSLGMEAGGDEPQHLAVEMPAREPEWAAVVRRHQLRAPETLDAMVGQSFVYADLLFGYAREVSPQPTLVSTIKIRQAGFGDCVDTEDMFRRLFRRMQERRLLPPV